MPQPYRRKAPLTWGYEALLARPQLSRHIAAIAQQWTEIETMWGRILALLLGETAPIGVEIYLTLNSAAAQGHIITGIADARLTGSLRARFRELWVLQRTRSEERNRLVHGQWGYDPSRDGFIALAERGGATREFVDIIGRVENRPTVRAAAYTEADFVAIERRLKEFTDQQNKLLGGIWLAPLVPRLIELQQLPLLQSLPSDQGTEIQKNLADTLSTLLDMLPGRTL